MRTRLPFELASAGPVSMDVFDMEGRRVLRESRSLLPAGPHAIDLRLPASAPPGTYLVRLTAGDTVDGRVMMLVR